MISLSSRGWFPRACKFWALVDEDVNARVCVTRASTSISRFLFWCGYSLDQSSFYLLARALILCTHLSKNIITVQSTGATSARLSATVSRKRREERSHPLT
eukprot:2475852-Amphidinium_carterae.2